MHGSSACLGCYKNPTLVKSVDEPPKGSNIQGQTVKKHSISEDIWTTSNCDMDNNAVQSQGSMSSINVVNQTLDPHGSSSSGTPAEFVNHGLLLWNQTRQRWIGDKRSSNRAHQSQEPKLNTDCLCLVKNLMLCCSWNSTYDSLLGSNKPFPQPIPLSEMVDFLVDVWEQEGMYD